MTVQHSVATVLALALLVWLASAQRADGQVPTTADSAACNQEAPGAVKAGMASPNREDRVRADRARGRAAQNAAGSPVQLIESPDPQIHGMDAQGARDAAYQAAYRGCMRRKGF
jgi:hypothetical protein